MLYLIMFLAADKPWPAEVRVPLKEALIQMEYVDPRERTYYFTGRDDHADLKMMLQRFEWLKDTPRLAACSLLPSREELSSHIGLNRRVREALERQAGIEPKDREWYDAAMAELDRVYVTLDTAREAQTEYFYVFIRRDRLATLRARQGEIGLLPVPVPRWVLEELK